MILRGVISNGGWTSLESGELLLRVSVDEMTSSPNAAEMAPSSMRGRSVAIVLGDAPVLPESFHQLSQPEAAIPDGDDALTVDAGTTPPTVVEHDA